MHSQQYDESLKQEVEQQAYGNEPEKIILKIKCGRQIRADEKEYRNKDKTKQNWNYQAG